jgi:hypothetical protein
MSDLSKKGTENCLDFTSASVGKISELCPKKGVLFDPDPVSSIWKVIGPPNAAIYVINSPT